MCEKLFKGIKDFIEELQETIAYKEKELTERLQLENERLEKEIAYWKRKTKELDE